MRNTIAVILLFAFLETTAQENTSWIMNPTKDDVKHFMTNFYQYKDFRNGMVVFTDSSFVSAKLNYQRYTDAVHFIGEKGDTLTLKNPASVLYAVMGRDTFFRHKDGFIQKLTGNTNINLGVKSSVRLIGKDKRGLYDSYNSVSSADNVSNFAMDNQILTSFTEDANYKFRAVDTHFFIDSAYRFHPVKKSTLLGLLPGKAAEINAYLDENKIDFDKQSSLLQLMWFLKWL